MKKILLIVVAGLFFLALASAISWPFDKVKTCELLNVSDDSCDSFWCEEVLGYNWSANETICFKVVNQTIILNNTNCTDLIANITNQTIINSTNISLEKIKVEMKNYTDFQLLDLRNSLLSRLDNATYEAKMSSQDQVYQQPREPTPYWFIAVCIFAVVGLVAWMSYNKMHAPTYLKARPVNRPIKTPERETIVKTKEGSNHAQQSGQEYPESDY